METVKKTSGRIEKCFKCGRDFVVAGKHDLYCERCRPSEHAKDVAAFKNMKWGTFLNLGGEVIKKACEDYIEAISKWHYAYTAEDKSLAFTNLKVFSRYFKSEAFSFWANDLNGEYLQRMLNRTAYEKPKKGRKNKSWIGSIL